MYVLRSAKASMKHGKRALKGVWSNAELEDLEQRGLKDFLHLCKQRIDSILFNACLSRIDNIKMVSH